MNGGRATVFDDLTHVVGQPVFVLKAVFRLCGLVFEDDVNSTVEVAGYLMSGSDEVAIKNRFGEYFWVWPEEYGGSCASSYLYFSQFRGRFSLSKGLLPRTAVTF